MSGSLRDHAPLGNLTAVVFVGLLTLVGQAIADEEQFPLRPLSMKEAASHVEMTRKALPAYQRMAADFEGRGLYGKAAIAYSNAAIAARALGRLQDELDTSQKAVAMAERDGKPGPLAVALLNLGWAHANLHEPQKAIPVFERAARLAKASGRAVPEATAYSGLSFSYQQTGRLRPALQTAMQAVTILEQTLASRTGGSGAGVGGQRSPEDVEWNYARALVELGGAHQALREWGLAKAAFQKALDVGVRLQEPFLTSRAHQGLGMVALRQDDLKAAESHLQEVIRLSARPTVTARVKDLLGRVYREQGRLPDAEAAFRQAVAGVEDLRSLIESEGHRETYFSNKIQVYELLVLTLLEQGKVIEAFDVSERARARAFLDVLGNRVSLTRSQDEGLIAEERALRERIAAVKALPEDSPARSRELELAREAYQAFLGRIRGQNREQASLMAVEPLTLPQVQALLPEGTLLLDYFVTAQQQTLLWTVDRETISVVVLPLDRVGIGRRVRAFREAIASPDRAADAGRLGRELFIQLVLPGLQGRMPRELLIVPHDALHYLPFHALMPAADRYLIQDVPLYYSSSASLIQFTRAKANADGRTLFALGNPDLQDPRLNLRYAEREVQGIAQLFPGAVVLIRRAATKAASRAESPTHAVLHFAAHAELDERDPLGSALRLTPASGDDGRLEVQEVFGLDLHASLVVLSACETSLGKLTRGDELTGLTRAFIYAGTPSVITTLWQVSDRASSELMQEFYRELKAGKDKAEALRQAQLATLQKYTAPYYWAAYQLTGEAR